MKNTYTPEQVRLCCTAYANGQSIATLSQDIGIPRSTIYTWIKREQEKAKQEKEKLPLKAYRLLEQKIERLEGIIEILKSLYNPSNLPIEEKVNLIENLQKKYSLRMICDALDFNRVHTTTEPREIIKLNMTDAAKNLKS